MLVCSLSIFNITLLSLIKPWDLDLSSFGYQHLFSSIPKSNYPSYSGIKQVYIAEEFQVSFANMNSTYKSLKKYNIILQIKNLFFGGGKFSHFFQWGGGINYSK